MRWHGVALKSLTGRLRASQGCQELFVFMVILHKHLTFRGRAKVSTDQITQENTEGKEIQRVNGRFAPGVSGNPKGRPKGARNVLSKSVLGTYAKEAANGDFERVMSELKRDNPAVYAKLLNDAAMKEAERAGSSHGGLCEACGGELESKTILSVHFIAPSKNHASQLDGDGSAAASKNHANLEAQHSQPEESTVTADDM